MSHFSSHTARTRRNFAISAAFLSNAPLLIVGAIVIAFVLQICMLLAVGNAPAENFAPAAAGPADIAHTQAEMPDCVMFCTEASTTQTMAAPGQAAISFDTTSGSPVAPECWLLCDNPRAGADTAGLLTDQRVPDRAV